MKKDKRQEDLKSYESPIVRLMEIKLEQGFVIGSANHEGFAPDSGMSSNHEGFTNDSGIGIVGIGSGHEGFTPDNGMGGNHEVFQ